MCSYSQLKKNERNPPPPPGGAPYVPKLYAFSGIDICCV